MLFRSTAGKSGSVTFREAVLSGLAPDGGLWMPVGLPRLPDDFFEHLSHLSLQEIGFEIGKRFIDNSIPHSDFRNITEGALNFDAPLVQLSEQLHVLELFHGPTLSFKDFGARFMAGVASYFLKDSNRSVVVLVATSGDTGSAVANAFYRTKGIRVVLLYPSGKVSEIQEKQMTTLGENISALEISGTFDDCQNLVKQAFQDSDLNSQLHLVSANSINIARLIPQSFYYFRGYGKLSHPESIVFSIPSGNFGNLTAGLFSKRMGLPIQQFIAATNLNDTVPVYLRTGVFEPRRSVKTLSNAMDVGNPSNFARMLAVYGAGGQMKKDVSGYGFSDDQTLNAMKEVYGNYGYVCDPHTAVAYLGWKMFPKTEQTTGIILSTAHPAKFPGTGAGVTMPERLKECLDKPNQSIVMENDFGRLKEFLKERRL